MNIFVIKFTYIYIQIFEHFLNVYLSFQLSLFMLISYDKGKRKAKRRKLLRISKELNCSLNRPIFSLAQCDRSVQCEQDKRHI